jgi:hypothetical protein
VQRVTIVGLGCAGAIPSLRCLERAEGAVWGIDADIIPAPRRQRMVCPLKVRTWQSHVIGTTSWE